MNRHQVLTGAANAGDHCYSVGSVEGVPFTAYASGCNIVILASNFQRVQIIPGLIHGNVQVGCLDASTDVGKIAAAYGREVCIYEPTPLLHQSSNHRLDYQWVQTAVIKSEFQLQVLSWNLSGTRLLTGGSNIQLWQLSIAGEDDIIEEEPTNIQVKCTGDDGVVTDIDEQCKWNCIWSCRTAQSVAFLKFSPDGTLFASAGSADRLVKIWYSSKIVSFSSQHHSGHSGAVNYTFIYIAHPRAVSGLSWRKTSKFMPKDSVANMLLTSCRDNICRIWVQSLMPEDGLVDLQQIDSIANQNLRVQTQRHRKKIMQRLKHMKSFNQLKKHQASQFTEDPHEPISILPSTYSVHDFHCFGMQGSGVTPSLHFHLAGTIDAKADIPLVPSLVGSHTKDPNFVVHWMNNKEMAFTHAAEHLLQDVSDKVLQLQHKKDMAILDHDVDKLNSENKVANGRRSSHPKSESSENINEPLASKQNSPSASSSTSIATDSSTSQSQSVSGDFIDRKIEKLLRDWHRSQDLLFSVYPVDGSFLVWSVDWLDEYHPGSFRQAIVNFASRIPNAVPLGDAATMSHNIFMYSPHAGLDLRLAISAAVSEQMIKDKAEKTEDGDAQQPVLDYAQWKHNCNKQLSQYCALSSTTPTVCMLTKHSNGSLNLWHVSFADTSPYTQVLSIGHFTRVCGHRFRINDVTCHPVLPLLLTTSHHNLPGQNQNNSNPSSPAAPLSPRCCYTPFMGLQSGFCSELILWKVDPVGPLSKSGGVTELARINSPETAAFANVAWIPTLLPSTTQGSISNSPSACFVASDGHQLRVYQAVIDARTLLAEISSSSRRKNSQDMSQSTSTSSGLGYKHSTLQDTFRIISEQSTSRPGCVIELDAISDATHDWQNTQLLHVFQEQLISSSPHRRNAKEASNISLVQPDLQAIVDLRHSSVFEEPFYLVVLEKQEEKSVLHMWKIIIASPFGAEDHEHQSFSYVPDSNLVQESDHSNQSSRSMSPDHNHDASYPLSQVSPLRITTVKVCTQVMPLPDDVEIVHATPAAGHLSSSNIYPACFAPYLICTACSDYTVRFWKCEILETGNKDEVEYNWVEWEMMLNKSPSSVRVSGQPLFVSCAYSGRMACAFKHGKSFTRHNSKNPESRFINVGVSIFECESTGGSEWMMEDTINLRNVSLPVPKLSLNLESLVDASQRNKRTADTLLQKLSTDETANERLPLQRLLSVPSYATLQTLRQAITEKGNQDLLAPKSLVQLDWVSAEDGSHILTVAIGSKVLLFSPVSNDIAQANVQAMKASKSASRPLLKQASSMVLPLSCNDEIRWMRIRSTPLKTADSLPPIPMQLSWVRHGILVVGMDSEMHIYSQWRVPVCNDRGQAPESEKDEPLVDDRKLTEEELLTRAQESSQLRLPTTSGTLSRSTSSNVLTAAAETKRKKSEAAKPQRESIASIGPMPDFGLFEASRLACPILPQYHPKQLMELLGFGKLRRVKAILSHLVRCLSGSENIKKTYLQVPESVGNEEEGDETNRTWSRTRAMSMAASSSPLPHSPNDQRGSVSVFPEEVTLDYVEIQSIPPLPLFTLIAADKELHSQTVQTTQDEALDQDYSGLFDVSMHMEDSLDDILHSKSVSGENKRERPSFSGNERKVNLTNFSPNQAASLTHFLTHSHLPGLSSLDQMHLLALADTVASFNTALSDRFGTEPVVSKGPNKTNVEGLNVTVTTDSLDDCGLRFLLAVRHYVYLTLCLPLSQRAQLQNQGLGSHSLVWAFHSETQEELLQLIPCMQKGTLKWSELRELGVGWWVRSNAVLKRLMEKVAKAAFQAKNDPMDAALYYLAMKKKTLLWGLFRSVSDTKMTAFFQNNFTQDKWKKSAMKNAYVLMGKQRFEHAAAFFLLGGDLKVAVEIILNHLNDLQLAMVVIRLYEGEIETVTPSLKKLLFVEVLGCEPDGTNYIPSKAYPDPFIRCMARWILQDYCGSLTTLLQTDVGYSHPRASEIENSGDRMSANPSVFNFYLFLRTHPLVVRRQRAQNLSELKKSKAAGKQNFRSESLDVEDAPFEDTITPLERRLFFTTAHAHFRAGCPALALEVLSRLPNRVLTDGPMSPDDAVFDFANVINEGDNVIATGLVNQDSMSQTTNKNVDWGQPVAASSSGGSAADFDWSQPSVKTKTEDTLDFDWGAPVTQVKEPELELDFGLDNSENEVSEEEDGIEIKAPEEPVKEIKNDSRPVTIDIMAQQLKFIACLKIMMEELSTLATGYEVDGGQLRYQLYIWLEKSVSALKDLCLYGASSENYDEAVNEESMAMDGSSHSNANWDSALDFSNQRASLHEILLADKLDFEAKLQRASRRKQWLKANEALLRTLLSYCSLHGAHGGGLAAVRMELILLLHELQQERSRQQLLSPLPFPTTLPLLAASVACQKTVVADPIRHLQSLAHDILLTIIDMTDPPAVSNASFSHLIVLRDLSTSLSACIYESLCDSDTFVVKQGGARGLSMEELISSGVVYQNSHLLAGHVNRIRHSSGEEDVKATTSPHKWPGVSSLRALLAQDKDEDSPKLHTLLCEAFVSVYVSQLIYALSTCDCHVLYRLVGQCFTKETWALLFGGGAKILLHISTTNSVEPTGSPASLEKENQSQSESGSGILDSLSRQRIKLHMKLLGQSGQQTTQPIIKEDKPTYREQFIPPKMSMVSLFMSKPKLASESDALDYDSNASLPSDEEEVEEGEMDDVFGGESTEEGHQATSGRKKIISDSGLDQLDPSSYTWGILRYAVVKLARMHIVTFLSIAGFEMQDLPVISPLIHSVLKCMDFWIKDLKQYMDSFESPPPNYIPGCSTSGPQIGPAVLKYSALLELNNTPFRSNHRAVLPVKRLWNYLVRQESVQDVFIRYIYQFKRVPKTDDFDIDAPAEGNSANLNSVRVIHKDQDTINTFCINRVKNGIIALATPKEIQEIDMSVLLQPVPWPREEAEFEAVNLLRAPDTLPSTDYLVIQHPADSLQANQSSSGSTPTTSGPTSIGASKNMKGLNFPGCTNPQFCQLVLQRSRYMLKPLKKHKIDGVRKLTSHPLMPVYLSGSQDGSVSLWEWNHAQPISSPRQAGTFAKVTKIAFNLQGNKFGVTDGDGIISLWQVGLGSVSNKPYFSTQCHSKQANDFAFLSSSSLIATAGQSTDNRNVCLWDTLLPQGKSLIASFQCHEGGCSSLVYAPQSHTLISAGKKGDICIFDVRQNKLKQKFQAHESPIKCLALDPAEEFFATGSADGDIKVWGLSVHVKLCTFNGEHTKSSLFRSINNGVSQMEIDEMGRLFSCGADGSLKFRTLPDNDIVNVL
ncbi:dmX-like protein 2 isoform X2 [Argiope bruennichi]|uniref:dmX-like protein 2 isoform X2 n=1 Tax=Argiope bruennichi TaxID=94029 RepID=UPI002495A105|nr:dmX-like protein 2 isoform X2 [Argiope bruennichi]